MKYLIPLVAALQGASAYPSVLNNLEPRAVVAKEGCTTSKLCNNPVSIPDSMIGVTGTPTTAQTESAGRTNCGQQGACPLFNPSLQYVSTSGAHAYASPLPHQIRGPCPGLNAAANHGYLTRSGVQTIASTVLGLGQCYGMAADLAGFLAVYAIAFDGDVVTGTWSIGGPPPIAASGVLGKPQGISYSHNKYEGDTSISRCDAYINQGDAHSLSVPRFKLAYETGMPDDRYTLDKFAQDFAKKAFVSEMQNKLYAAPLFSTTLVAPAAYNFVINMMSNHSTEEPSGYLNGAIFKEFFAISGEYPDFKWNPGQERIPENWYRRPYVEGYSAVAGVFGDLASQFAAYPSSFRFGGNTNGVNTYTGINITDATGGAYNLDTLFQGNNLACFFFEQQQQVVPDELKGGFNGEQAAFKLISKYLSSTFGNLNCPKIQKYNDNSMSQYPGYKYSPTGAANNC